MRYAIVASAWLFAWGAVAPQDATAGFVLSGCDATLVDDHWSARASFSGGLRGDDDGSPRRDRRELLALLDQMLGVLQIPSGSESSSSGSSRTPSVQFAAAVDPGVELLSQLAGSSQLAPEQMFSLREMFKSSVFRPPRA